MPPDRNGNGHQNGWTGDDYERHSPLDDGAELPPEPLVPPGDVLHTDSRGVSIIAPHPNHGLTLKRTAANRAKVLAAVRLGCTYKLAAAYGNMSYDALLDWRKADPEFDEAIENAVGIAAAQWMNVIETASKVDWRAAAWKLQHRFPTEYGRNINEVSGPNGGPIPIRELTVRVPDSLGIDEIDEGPPQLTSGSDE